MNTDIIDRMPRRGRPKKDEPKDPPQPVEPTKVEVDGIRCLGCGRSILPRVVSGSKLNGYMICPQCGVRLHREGNTIRRVFPSEKLQ